MVSTGALVVFGIIGVAIVLFVSEAIPTDVTAIGIIVSLAVLEPLTGIDHQLAISGFASTATITIVAMYMLSAAINQTGVIQRLGYHLATAVGGNERRAVIATVATTGPLAGFVNNTPVVAMFIPMITDLADRLDISPSKLLLPLSFAAILGGTLTLIGTSTNLIASEFAVELLERGPIEMFEFTALGALILLVGATYLFTIGYWLTPARIAPNADLVTEFDLSDHLTFVRVRGGGVPNGKTIAQLEATHDIRILQHRPTAASSTLEERDPPTQVKRELQPDGGSPHDKNDETSEEPVPAGPIEKSTAQSESPSDSEISEGDILTLHGTLQAVNQFVRQHDALEQLIRKSVTEESFGQTDADGILAKMIVPPDSAFVGQRIHDTHLRSVYDTTVLAVRREEALFRTDLADVKIAAGDVLLVQTVPESVGYFYESDEIVVIEDTRPVESRSVDKHAPPSVTSKAPVALGIMATVVSLAALGYVSIVIAALGGVVGMILTRCLTINQAYEAVSWNVIFLLAGVIPLGYALETTGGAALIAGGLVTLGDVLPVVVVLFALYLLTGLLSNVITPVASVVLMIPVGIQVGRQLGAPEFSFLLTVMFAGATSFMTPVGYQTNLMVYGPGGYTFMDFVRVGAPLQFLLAVVSTGGIVVLWGI